MFFLANKRTGKNPGSVGVVGSISSKDVVSNAQTKKKRLKLTCYGIEPNRPKLEEYREKQREDLTKDNLKMIKKVRSIKVNKNLATNLLKGMGKIPISEVEKSVDKTNFITENDFKKYIIK